MNRIKIVFVSLLAAVMSGGCVGQQFGADCYNFIIKFRYRFEITGTVAGEPLRDLVSSLSLYAFDQSTGRLAAAIDASAEEIAEGAVEVRGLSAGVYTFVFWGVSSAEANRSFSVRHMTDAANHRHDEVVIGQTTLAEFHMMLSHEVTSAEVPGDIAPVQDDFDDLYHAIARDVEIVGGENRTIEMQAIRNTNMLDITITGLEYLDQVPKFDIYVLGKNGRYGYDNTIDTHARTVRYVASEGLAAGAGAEPATGDEFLTSVKILRLDMERHLSEPVCLYIKDSETGVDLIKPLDVIGAISQIRDETGAKLYDTQTEIDRQYRFPIRVSILPDLRVVISILDWVVVDLDPDVNPYGK